MNPWDRDGGASVVISRRLRDAVQMGTMWVLCLVISAVVIFLFAKDLLNDPSVLGALVLGLGTPVLLGGTLYVAVYWSRIASNAEFGDEIALRTLFRRRCYAWTELARLELSDHNPMISSLCLLKLLFTDGCRYEVFVNREQGDALLQLAHDAPLARDWPGAPLPAVTAGTLVGLGGVAIALCVWIICDPVTDVVRNGITNNRSGIDADNVAGLVLVTVAVSLAGAAGVGVGAYHLVRRPIATRSGIYQRRAGKPLERVDE